MPFAVPNQYPAQKQYQAAAPQMPKPGLSIPPKPKYGAGPLDLGAPRQIGPPQQPQQAPAPSYGASLVQSNAGPQGGVYAQPWFQQQPAANWAQAILDRPAQMAAQQQADQADAARRQAILDERTRSAREAEASGMWQAVPSAPYPGPQQGGAGPNFSGNYQGNPNVIAANAGNQPQPLPKPVGEPIAQIDPVAVREESRRNGTIYQPGFQSQGPLGIRRRPMGRGYRPY